MYLCICSVKPQHSTPSACKTRPSVIAAVATHCRSRTPSTTRMATSRMAVRFQINLHTLRTPRPKLKQPHFRRLAALSPKPVNKPDSINPMSPINPKTPNITAFFWGLFNDNCDISSARYSPLHTKGLKVFCTAKFSSSFHSSSEPLLTDPLILMQSLLALTPHFGTPGGQLRHLPSTSG